MTIRLGMAYDAMRELPRRLQLRCADEAEGREDDSSEEGRSCWRKLDLMCPSVCKGKHGHKGGEYTMKTIIE